MHVCARLYKFRKAVLKSSFGMLFNTDVTVFLMASTSWNLVPFSEFFSLGNRKKSAGARSGEYGGCCISTTPCWAKNRFTGNAAKFNVNSLLHFHFDNRNLRATFKCAFPREPLTSEWRRLHCTCARKRSSICNH